MTESAYERIDRAVYRAERAIVVVSLVVMAVVVFLDVVHRSFAGDSKVAMVVAKIGGWFGPEIVEGTPAYQSIVDVAPWVSFAVFTWLVYFGIRSTKRDVPVSSPIAAGAAVASVLATYGLVRLLLVLLPNGLVWSQPLALILTLWVGFVGASMCTYERRHLRVEAVQRLLPEKVRPYVAFASGVLTTLVCLALLWVSLRYVRFNYEEYVSTEGKGGLFLGMDLPKYLGFVALPISFGFMSVRFFMRALGALRGEVDAPLDPVAAAGGIPEVLDDDADHEGGAPWPSDVPTEAVTPSSEEISIDTLTSSTQQGGRGRQPPSKIPTDAHRVVPTSGKSELDGRAEAPSPVSGSLEATSMVRPSGSSRNAVVVSDETLAAEFRRTRELDAPPALFDDDTRDLPGPVNVDGPDADAPEREEPR